MGLNKKEQEILNQIEQELLKEDPDLPRLEAYVQAYNEWIK